MSKHVPIHPWHKRQAAGRRVLHWPRCSRPCPHSAGGCPRNPRHSPRETWEIETAALQPVRVWHLQLRSLTKACTLELRLVSNCLGRPLARNSQSWPFYLNHQTGLLLRKAAIAATSKPNRLSPGQAASSCFTDSSWGAFFP